MSESEKVLLTTYKVIIDANDLAQAREIAEGLHAQGFRVHLQKNELVNDDGVVVRRSHPI